MSIDLMNKNGLTLKNTKSRRYIAKTITDAYYADLAFLTNTPVQAKSQLYSLEQAASGIGLYVNADKTEFICFKQDGVISALNGMLLKLVNQFTYFSSIY